MRENFIGKIKLFNYKDEMLPTVIASFEPTKVTNYEELVTKISGIAFDNPHLNLYFRGQNRDYESYNMPSSLLSQFHRRGNCTFLNRYKLSLVNPCCREIYLRKVLSEFSKSFLLKLKNHLKFDRIHYRFIERYEESKWAMLQHYGYPTPLLDVTKSIRAAASFATKIYKPDSTEVDNPSSGFVYVLGFPEIQGYISYFAYEAIVITRLLGTCPPQAKRPHFQDAYFVGTIPHEKGLRKEKDFRNCLVAKFRIDNTTKAFWNDMQVMGINEIYPKDDKVKEIADSMEDDFIKLCEKNGLSVSEINADNSSSEKSVIGGGFL